MSSTISIKKHKKSIANEINSNLCNLCNLRNLCPFTKSIFRIKILNMKNEIAVSKTPEQQINGIMSRIKVFDRDGELWTDSLSVAEVFGKEHKNVLERIRQIDQENRLVGLLTFKPSSYINSQNKEQTCFEMTETGFFALVARFNDQRDTDIALIRSCYFKEFDRLKKEKMVISGNDILIGLSVKLTNMLEELKDQSIQTKIEHHEMKHEVIQFKGKIVNVEKKMDDVIDKVNTFEEKLTKLSDKRRLFSQPDTRRHIEFVFKRYNGKCPLCGEVQILNAFKERINNSDMDHFWEKTKNRYDQGWLICKSCNLEMAAAKKDKEGIPYRDATAIFTAYQVGLSQWMNKCHKQKSFEFKGGD